MLRATVGRFSGSAKERVKSGTHARFIDEASRFTPSMNA